MEDIDGWRSSELNPPFIGREREMEWLFERFRQGRRQIVISGLGGVGKTTLLKHFLASARVQRPPLFLDAQYAADPLMIQINEKIDELYRDRSAPEIVAIDDANPLNEQQLNAISDRILELKAVRMLIFTSRMVPSVTRADVLQLPPLKISDTEHLLTILGANLPREDLARVAEMTSGLPLAIRLIASLARGRSLPEIQRLLQGEIYNLKRQVILPAREIITEVRPRIISTKEALLEHLQTYPESVFDLPPRKFEEVVAELLTNLGYEVELTPATRDGGKDMLAYMSTPHGRLLCLVEVKKYRRDRTIGVELVRQLYGTLTDADASSAMLVTTSSFSPDAKAFQQRHQYKLALRDYGNVVQWIQGYKKN